MAINADATLVSAAYNMGMANVPHDTSKIFQQQYEALAGIETARLGMYGDIVEGAAQLFDTGVKTYAKVKGIQADKEWYKRLDDLSANHLYDNALNWDTHFKNKKRVDSDTAAHAENEITAMKDEIQWLEKNARGKKQNKKISKLRKNIVKWREETNNMFANTEYHNTLWASDQVDKTNSFKVRNPKTGTLEFRADLMDLYNQVMDPSFKLSDGNIERMRHPKTGQIGFAFNPKDDRLAQMYRRIKAKESMDVDPRQIMTSEEIDKMGKRTAWISQDELLSMVKPKDNWSPTAVTSDMTNVLKSVSQMKDTYTRDPKTGALKTVKNGEFMHTNYDGVRKKTEEQFYNTLMSPTQDDGNKGQQPRDARQSITYLSNNKWFLGNTEIDYNEHSSKNPAITTASYTSLGLTGSVDADGNQILEGDELTDDDRTAIHNRLMNPQNQAETEVAAREMARYLNLQTEIKFLKDRGIVGVTKKGKITPPPGKNTINLPWQKNIKEGQNQREINQQTLVDGVLAGRDRVLAGNDIYTRRANGKDYQLTGEIVEDREKSISGGSIVTGRSLIETRGGRFGKIPVDFDFAPLYKTKTSSATTSKANVYNPMDEQITIKQMKDALKGSGGPYDLNAPDEQIKKMYKKWVISLMQK